jgi:hypothetical protein
VIVVDVAARDPQRIGRDVDRVDLRVRASAAITARQPDPVHRSRMSVTASGSSTQGARSSRSSSPMNERGMTTLSST